MIFSYLKINSTRKKFNDLEQFFCSSVVVVLVVVVRVTRAETKIDSSFPAAQFCHANYHMPYRLDISDKSGGILVYIKSNIPTCQLNCGIFCKSRKEKWFVIW